MLVDTVKKKPVVVLHFDTTHLVDGLGILNSATMYRDVEEAQKATQRSHCVIIPISEFIVPDKVWTSHKIGD